MGRIVQFRGDPHEEAQRLLPWFANNTLEPDEWASVESHLAGCAECRADLEIERTLCAEVSTIDLDAVRNFAVLRERIGAQRAQKAAEPRPQNDNRSVFQRPVALGWVLCAQAAMLALVTGIIELPRNDGPALYRTLGAAPAVASGNIVIIFRPSITERELRAVLSDSGARVVDGPSSSGAWVVRVSGDRRPDALARLRRDPLVRLAEPVDAGIGP